MRTSKIVGGLLAAVLVVVALAVGYRAFEGDAGPAATGSPTSPAETATARSGDPSATSSATRAPPAHQGYLYGRVTTDGGVTYQGRLRFGTSEEGFWNDHFNGYKEERPWLADVPPDVLPKQRDPISILGVELAVRERTVDLRRPFMTRFGDLVRIEKEGRDLRVTLKSGTTFHLDRYNADDFADGVQVWDAERGVVELGERQVRSIDFLPTARLGATPERLHGAVRTRDGGTFTGFVQWDRSACVGSDRLDGRTADGEVGLRFDTIRSIAQRSPDSSRVTLGDGREVVLSGTRDVGKGNSGVFVHDPRYGRVLVPWDAFVRLDLSPGGSGPAYDDFPPGRPLRGRVTTRAGRSLAGRLVFDLDESETTETLDAPSGGVDHALPFGLVASIVPGGGGEGGAQPVRVALHNGEELQLERAGDLGDDNGGMLVFTEGRGDPEYVPWGEIERIDLDRPPAMYPPLGGR